MLHVAEKMAGRVAGAARPDRDAWPMILERFGGLVPPYPRLELARVPAPPLLPDGTPIVECAWRVGAAFREVLDARFRVRRRIYMSPEQTREDDHFLALVATARALRSERIAPLAWCAFSADVWRERPPAPGVPRIPSVPWVCSDRRVRERGDWFREESGRYAGGQARTPDALRRLLARYEDMRRALLALRDPDEAAVEHVVQAHLPAGRYDGLMATARAAVARDAELIRTAMARGECLW